MKASIFSKAGEIVVEERPIPTPGPNDVVIKNKRAAICGTDLTAYLYGGDLVAISAGSEFGHEFVGEVFAVGDQVNGVQPGMRVFVNPARAKKTGDMGCNTCGAFSEYVLVEDAALDYNLFELPENLSYDDAVITEPYCVSAHGVNSVKPQKDEKALIFGAGPIGLGTLAALKSMGFADIVVTDIVESRLEKVKALGGIPLNPSVTDMRRFLEEHFGRTDTVFGKAVDIDIYIDCAGLEIIPPDFISLAKDGARLAVVAIHKKPVLLDLLPLMAKQLQIVGSCAYTSADIKQVLGFLANNTTELPANIITHHFKVDDIQKAFETAANQQEAIKVVIDYD